MEIDRECIVGFTEDIEIIGDDASVVVEAKSDTGAKRVSIDERLAKKVGIGDQVKTVTVHSSNGSEERPVYNFELIINGHVHEIEASITDRSKMSNEVILGRDVLCNYLVDCGEITGE